MIYLIPKNLWAEGNETQVRTAVGDVVLRLEKKSSSLSSTSYIIYDRYHVELGSIKKGAFSRSYDITYDGNVIGSVYQKKRFFAKWYVISTTKGEQFKISSKKIAAFEYNIVTGRKKVAQIHHKLGSNSRTYGFETIDEQNKYLLLCSTLALQLMHL